MNKNKITFPGVTKLAKRVLKDASPEDVQRARTAYARFIAVLHRIANGNAGESVSDEVRVTRKI
jgi:hypothetical protein